MNVDAKTLLKVAVLGCMVVFGIYLFFPQWFEFAQAKEQPKEIIRYQSEVMEVEAEPLPEISLDADLQKLILSSRTIALSNTNAQKWNAEVEEKAALASRNQFITQQSTVKVVNEGVGQVRSSTVEEILDDIDAHKNADKTVGSSNSADMSLVIKSVMVPKNGKTASAYISFNGKQEVLVYESQIVEGVSIAKIEPHELRIVVGGKRKVIPVI
ncbi:hypothetical protein ACODM8_15995 [Vibrio ostreicida]|uniref:hypothetical protein n=1 Tax=Vibrio ostreicida TaxID=526588 RepID=UPI003B5A2C8E